MMAVAISFVSKRKGLTDSDGEGLTLGSLEQALGFLRVHQVHQARLRVYDAQNEALAAESQEFIIKF